MLVIMEVGSNLGETLFTPIPPFLGPFPVPFAFVQDSSFTCSAQSMPLTLIAPTHLFLAPHLVVCCFETQFRNYPFMFHLHVLGKFPSTVSKMSLFLHISSEQLAFTAPGRFTDKECNGKAADGHNSIQQLLALLLKCCL